MKISVSEQQIDFQGLQTVLNYQLSGIMLAVITILILLSYVIPIFFTILIYLLSGVAVLLTPYMLIVLFFKRKYGWLIFFSFMVLIPLLVTFLFLKGSYLYSVSLYILLAFFYFYCYLLKHVLNDWI